MARPGPFQFLPVRGAESEWRRIADPLRPHKPGSLTAIRIGGILRSMLILSLLAVLEAVHADRLRSARRLKNSRRL